MKCVVLSTKGEYENVLIAITPNTYKEIADLLALAIAKQELPNEGTLDTIAEVDIKLTEVVFACESNTIDEESAREVIPRRIFQATEKFTKEEKSSTTFECYGIGKPVVHYSAKSSFKCALEQLGLPTYCLVFLNKLPDVTSTNHNPPISTQSESI